MNEFGHCAEELDKPQRQRTWIADAANGAPKYDKIMLVMTIIFPPSLRVKVPLAKRGFSISYTSQHHWRTREP